MSGIFAIAIGVLLLIVAAPAFRGTVPRMSFYAVAAGFIYWYWVPAVNLLTVGYIGVSFFEVTASVDSACFIALASEVAVLAILLIVRPLIAGTQRSHETFQIAAPWLGTAALASAALSLVYRFASEGLGVLADLASGLSSAREFASFANLSTGASQSLFALWEVATILVALIALARHMFTRSLTANDGAATLAAIAVMFVSSGTRTVLLQAIFVTAVVALVRPKALRIDSGNPAVRALLFSATGIGAFAIIVAAFTARFAADGGYAAAGPGAVVLDTLFSNNDMMRELAFVFDTMQPSSQGIRNFALTPLSYMLPSFLGFTKELPYHLLAYNQARVGIDLYTGEGNVFPGIVADFWLVLGWAGALGMAGFVAISVLVINALGLLTSRLPDRWAYVAACLSYLFFDFRNITGAFGLVILLGAAVIVALSLVGRDRVLALPAA